MVRLRNVSWALLGMIPRVGLAQGPVAPRAETPAPRLIRLFLDVQQATVDEAFLKSEIPWVDWVRDPKDAEVHLILTVQRNLAGGTAHTLRFIGRGAFQGIGDETSYHAPGTATSDEIRRGLADHLTLGLARYLARRPGPERMGVVVKGGSSLAPPIQGAKDPWNAWVYQVGLNGFFNGETQYSASTTSVNLSASRITENELFRFNSSGNWNASRYVLSDETLRTNTESYAANLLWAHGLSDHWTWGLIASADRSNLSNLESAVRGAAAVEFNVWKYVQSTQRQFTFLYQIGAGRNRYIEETIYRKTSETLWDNSLAATLSLNQPWGTVTTSLTGSAYLDDWSKHSVALSNTMTVRLGKGFSLNLTGIYSRVKNQVSLSAQGATDEEILLRLKQLQTSYTYFASIGISYTFGSMFNNAVNARFASVGGGRW